MSRQSHANRPEATARLRSLLDEPPVAALALLPVENRVLLVGGALRDRLLRRPVRDFDVVVACNGAAAARELAERFETRAIALGGDRFAAYRLEAPGFRIDLWDRGRMSLEDDLRRRDLTVNSMALELSGPRLIDLFGGLEDLGRRSLRATSERSFAEDPLRVLRLARFSAELPGFEVEPETLRHARAAAGALESVAPERVREELHAIFRGPGAETALGLLIDLGVYPAFWTAGAAAPPADAAHRRLERLGRRATQLETELRPDAVDRFVAAQAVLFARLSSPGEHLRAFHGRRLLSNRQAQAIGWLLDQRELPWSDEDARWFLHRAGELWPTAAVYLGATVDAQTWQTAGARLSELARSEADAIFAPAPLLDGHEIAELLGIAPGPRLGELAGELRRAQIEGRISTRSAAADWLRQLVKSGD